METVKRQTESYLFENSGCTYFEPDHYGLERSLLYNGLMII
jgi:hypothetical protein